MEYVLKFIYIEYTVFMESFSPSFTLFLNPLRLLLANQATTALVLKHFNVDDAPPAKLQEYTITYGRELLGPSLASPSSSAEQVVGRLSFGSAHLTSSTFNGTLRPHLIPVTPAIAMI